MFASLIPEVSIIAESRVNCRVFSLILQSLMTHEINASYLFLPFIVLLTLVNWLITKLVPNCCFHPSQPSAISDCTETLISLINNQSTLGSMRATELMYVLVPHMLIETDSFRHSCVFDQRCLICVFVCVLQAARLRGSCCRVTKSSWFTMNLSAQLLENESLTWSGRYKQHHSMFHYIHLLS